MSKVLRIHYHTIVATQSSATSQRHRRDAFLAQAPRRSTHLVGVDSSTGRALREEDVVELETHRCQDADDVRRSQLPPRLAVRAAPSTNAAPEASIGMRRRGAAGAETRSSSPRRSLLFFSTRS